MQIYGDFYNAKFGALKGLGRYREAMKTQEQYVHAEDVFAREQGADLQVEEQEFEEERKQFEILQATREERLRQEKTQYQIIAGSTLILVTLLFGGIIFYQHNRQNARRKETELKMAA